MRTVGDDALGAAFLSAAAALHSVPAVSTMSSMMTQVRPSTSPMMFITSETLALGRRLSMMARSHSRRFGQRTGTDDAAVVRRDHQQVLVILFLDVIEQDRQCVDVVDRDVEEALDLFGVQVHRQHAVNAGSHQHVGDELWRRSARARSASGDPGGRSRNTGWKR